MHERHDSAARKRAHALQRYIRALEQGDGDALAAVLRQAQDDSTLEQLLLALHDVYLDAEEMAVHPDEVAHAREAFWPQTRDSWNGRYQTGDAHRADWVRLPHRQEQTWKRRTWEMRMQDTPDITNEDLVDSQEMSDEEESGSAPFLAAQTQSGNTGAISRRSRAVMVIQAIAAVLVVAVMAGSFYALFSSHLVRQGNGIDGSGHSGISRTGVTLASGEGVVLVGSRDSDILALRARDGALVWRYTTGSIYPISSLVAQDGVVYATTEYGDISAVRIADGTVLWNRDFKTFEGFPVALAVVSGVLIAPFPDGAVALNTSDGALLWRDRSGRVVGAGEGAVYVDSSETVTPASITTGPTQLDSLKALNITDGKLLWSYALHRRNESVSTVYVAASVVYVTASYADSDAPASTLSAVHATDGTPIWTHVVHDFPAPYAMPFSVSGALLFAHAGDSVCAVRIDTGTTRWCAPTPGLDRAVTADDLSIYLSREERDASTSKTVLAVGALRGDDGSQRWYWRSEPQRPTNGSNRYGASIGGTSPSIAAIDGVAYAGSTEGVYAIRGSDGHQLWHALDSEAVMALLAARAG